MNKTQGVVNIARKGRRQRALVGGAMIVVVAAGLFLFARNDFPLFARLAFLPPLFAAGLGLFQAQAGTWVALAARGTRDLGDGEQLVTDANEDLLLRAQAKRVYMRSGLLAVFGTLGILLLPL